MRPSRASVYRLVGHPDDKKVWVETEATRILNKPRARSLAATVGVFNAQKRSKTCWCARGLCTAPMCMRARVKTG
jgi:hypothetical protein